MSEGKRLLLLGGSRYLVPVIECAHAFGCHVITMDYLPDNVAHRYSDEYVNVSIVDKDAVLSEARSLKIDGVMSFACDPGVVTAAYVAEQLSLPFQCSYEAACILQDKGRFREFLLDNGFNAPWARRYEDKVTALQEADSFPWPVIVKPVDSAGSKGVTRVNASEGLSDAIDDALSGSLCGAFIVEQFLTFDGYHSSADALTVDGEVEFITYSDQLFDPDAENPYTPAFIIWPTTMEQAHQNDLTEQTRRLMRLLGMRNGIYNIETCVGEDGTPYLMEVSPRGGGCKIADIQKLAYGIDLIECEVRSALGLPVSWKGPVECDGHWCEMVVHAAPGQSGILEAVEIDPAMRRDHVKVVDVPARPGDLVEPFSGANMALGDIFLRFDTRAELDEAISDTCSWLRVKLVGRQMGVRGGRGDEVSAAIDEIHVL